MVAVTKTGQKIFTPAYIERIKAQEYKRSIRGSSSTAFGYMHPVIPCGVLNTVGAQPDQKEFRVMDCGPGKDYQLGKIDGISGVVEPLEILGHFLVRGKTATIDCYDVEPMKRFTSHLFDGFSGQRSFCQVAEGLGVTIKKDRYGRPCIKTADIPPEKIAGIRFHEADILHIEDLVVEPYDLIFILNVFNCLPEVNPETKDNVFYHAIQLLKPNGILVFNDYNNSIVKNWGDHFAERMDDLGLHGWRVRYSDRDTDNYAKYVINGSRKRWLDISGWPFDLGSRVDDETLCGDYRRIISNRSMFGDKIKPILRQMEREGFEPSKA